MTPLLGITYTFRKALPKLFGRSPIKSMETPKHLGEKLKLEAQQRGLKTADIAKEFGVKGPSVYGWYNHGSMHEKHYQHLLDWSGKPIEYWLNLRARPADSSHFSDKATLLAELFDALPDAAAIRQRVFMTCCEEIRQATPMPSAGPQTPAPNPFPTPEKSAG